MLYVQNTNMLLFMHIGITQIKYTFPRYAHAHKCHPDTILRPEKCKRDSVSFYCATRLCYT